MGEQREKGKYTPAEFELILKVSRALILARLGFKVMACETYLRRGHRPRRCKLLAVCQARDPYEPLPCELPDEMVGIPARPAGDHWLSLTHEPLRKNPHPLGDLDWSPMGGDGLWTSDRMSAWHETWGRKRLRRKKRLKWY